ncbi:MAG: hypothetical protein AUI14_03480 [Actinobacteria bacterium 13_2_20CM_2_71_6]|nr:MAG: hypothetical protein AUI14_03480 [Actinobacteria bacterium 13_2_20CM_2_71_6]
MTAWFALLPVLTLVFAAVAGYPAGADPAPVRLAVIRGALATGALGVVSAEALSVVHLLTPLGVRAMWALSAVVAGLLALRRFRVLAPFGAFRVGALRARLAGIGVAGWVLVAGLGLLALAELVVAVVAAPNNADSLSYHLPRIENWAQNGSVAFFPTEIHRQAGNPPGAEYLLLHLRLLAGPEEFYNILQWAAALGCAVVASRIAAQLGAGRVGQLLTATTVLTAPLVALEATSTQTDLVVGFWVVSGAALAWAWGRTTWGEAGWLGLAIGLTAVTKVNGLAVLGPFVLVWAGAQVRRWRPLVPKCAAVLAIAALLAGPFVVRAQQEWHDPMGDPALQTVALGRHDPAAVTINGVRIAATVLATTSGRVNSTIVDAVDGVAGWLHIPADDPKLVYGADRFGSVAQPFPDEDHAAYPIQALAVLLALAVALLGRRRDAPVRWYAVASALSLVLTAALIAWQPWITRLILPTFLVCTPLVGWAADRLLDRSGLLGRHNRVRGIPAGLVGVLVLVAGARAAYAVWAGQPRPLGTVNSVLAVSREHDRYVRERWREVPYQQAAQRIARSGASRIGLIQDSVAWEQAWWIELRRAGVHPTIVSLTSALPKHPAPGIDTVDAALCTLPPPGCVPWVPKGWTVDVYPGVVVLLPPGR